MDGTSFLPKNNTILIYIYNKYFQGNTAPVF